MRLPAGNKHVDIAIVGAGFGGLGAAILLQQHGYDDVLIFERADDVGGTWRDNSYPGCTCDVPSHLYSFSFALKPSWSASFSGQAEIWSYLRDCVTRFGLAGKLRLGHTVEAAGWDEDGQHWRITTSQGSYTARVLIAASGPLSDPTVPDLDGLDSFAGTTFHSARWRHDHDLTGRRVAVIGTGASAAQFIPEIQPRVAHLSVFQRTPAWVLPRLTRRITDVEQAVYRRVPGAQRLVRTAIYWRRETWATGFLHPPINRFGQRLSERHLRRQVPDPALRAKLRPDYVMGCKRILLSNDYWAALARDNVDVVTEKIQRLEPTGIVTTDGVRHEVDTIVFATGFRVTDRPIGYAVRGRDGCTLAAAWTPTMRAYLGTAVHGFPNLFLLLGPNTALGHSSVVLMIEAQLKQVVKALQHLRRTGAAAIEPTAAAQQRHTARIDRAMSGTVWATGGCSSYYLDATGRNSTVWPGYVSGYQLRLARFRPGDYVTTGPVRR
ncbi:MAG TPA: NAD(P)/FAD-dependent oxidoreductase [Jiangellaceae bacterium]|nr:NAD(P)/FAD-dependent oxidoreductase [Jiangellaceae bacterium]